MAIMAIKRIQIMKRPRQWAILGIVVLLSFAFCEGTNSPSSGHSGKEDMKKPSLQSDIDNIIQKSALAGKFNPILKKFILTAEQRKAILAHITDVADMIDVVLILLMGWVALPTIRFMYDQVYFATKSADSDVKPFRNTYMFQITDLISQIAKIALFVYIVDLFNIVIEVLDLHFPRMTEFSQMFATVAYTLWATNRIQKFKRYVLSQTFKCTPEKMGRAKVLDRILEAFIYGIMVVILFDALSVPFGFAGKSIFTIGSIGTLTVSLASQTLVSNFLNGLALSVSDKIYEGDQVVFGDGTKGTVVSLGWMETVIRESDEIIVSVPNSQLGSRRISNLSRIHQCQVKQNLRFHYEDAGKLEKVMEDIKDSIREACPRLILDGSRAFRVYWNNYNSDHLEVVVDAHFFLPPTGNLYYDNRQKVLQAIHKAVTKNEIEFAVEKD